MKPNAYKKVCLALGACMALASMSFDAAASKKVGIVAHRGYWNCEEAGYARNSIAALACAQKAGFFGSEFDVNITSDGVPIVVRDGTIDGKVIAEHPYSEFKDIVLENGEKIPTLEQYLIQGKKSRKTMLVCELKDQPSREIEDRLLDAVVAELKKQHLYKPGRVMFISFSRYLCDRVAAEMPQFTNQYLGSLLDPADLHSSGINGIDFHYSVFTKHPDWYPMARKLGMSVNCWTVNNEDAMNAMIELGVDFITTGKPDLLRDTVRSVGVKEGKR